VARLANLVRDEGLAFAAHGLGSTDQFWRVRWAHDPNRAVLGQTRLCVSEKEAWVRYDGEHWLGEATVLDTVAVPLEQIAPIDLLGHCEVDLTSARARTHQQPYADRLRALQEAEQAFEIAEHALATMDQDLDSEPLMRALALWWTDEQLEALHRVRSGLEEMGPWMETWEEALERERQTLCCEILGVRLGDSVSVASGTRVRLERVHLIFPENDGELVFLLHGPRYRKDGLPGKRADSGTVRVPWMSVG